MFSLLHNFIHDLHLFVDLLGIIDLSDKADELGHHEGAIVTRKVNV